MLQPLQRTLRNHRRNLLQAEMTLCLVRYTGHFVQKMFCLTGKLNEAMSAHQNTTQTEMNEVRHF